MNAKQKTLLAIGLLTAWFADKANANDNSKIDQKLLNNTSNKPALVVDGDAGAQFTAVATPEGDDPNDKLDIVDMVNFTAIDGEDDPETASKKKLVLILSGTDSTEVMNEAVATFDRFDNVKVYTYISPDAIDACEFIIKEESVPLKGKKLWPLKAGSLENVQDYINGLAIKAYSPSTASTNTPGTP